MNISFIRLGSVSWSLWFFLHKLHRHCSATDQTGSISNENEWSGKAVCNFRIETTERLVWTDNDCLKWFTTKEMETKPNLTKSASQNTLFLAVSKVEENYSSKKLSSFASKDASKRY